MTRPRLLDLFCKAGGAGVGYWRAGFDVIGVDIEPQPNYPFAFWQGDALAVLADLQQGDFHAVHASPPCQAFTTMSAAHRARGIGRAMDHPDLIEPVRWELRRVGLPYIIENVPGAYRRLESPVTLTGGSFGLRVYRPRHFESNFLLLTPPKASKPKDFTGVYGDRPQKRDRTRLNGGGRGTRSVMHVAHSTEEAAEALGIDWPVTWRECAESIPPAYTEFLGRQLLRAVAARTTESP